MAAKKSDQTFDADAPEALVDPEPIRAGGFVLIDGVWKPIEHVESE